MTDGSCISPESLCIDPREGEEAVLAAESAPAPPHARDVTPLNPAKTLKDVEKTLICDTLNRMDGNKTKAAKLLGISVRTLWNKVNEYRTASGKSD
jgi:two-component system response regulator FlrC